MKVKCRILVENLPTLVRSVSEYVLGQYESAEAWTHLGVQLVDVSDGEVNMPTLERVADEHALLRVGDVVEDRKEFAADIRFEKRFIQNRHSQKAGRESR